MRRRIFISAYRAELSREHTHTHTTVFLDGTGDSSGSVPSGRGRHVLGSARRQRDAAFCTPTAARIHLRQQRRRSPQHGARRRQRHSRSPPAEHTWRPADLQQQREARLCVVRRPPLHPPHPSRVTSGWVADARTYTHGRERGRQTTTVVATAFPISLPPSVITIDLCSSDSRGGQV